jgi:acetolactate synthase-1/2/3 large subunit
MVGYPLAMETTAEADVILALGCTFNQVTTASYTNRVIPEGAKIIQVDIDPTEFGNNFPIAVGIVGDLQPVLQDIIARLAPEGEKHDKEERLQQILKSKEAWEQRLLSEGAESDTVPINRLRLMRDFNKVIDKDAIISAESGSTHGWFYYGFKSYTPLLEPGDLSCMGSGWCMAMGAHFAYPDRQVVSFIGDGAFMMTLNELATAVEHKIPIIAVVEHNAVYGNVRRKQIEHFGERFSGSELYIPDLAQVAKAFGAHGERIEKPEEIIPAFERALSSGKPAVLDVILDKSYESLETSVKLRVKDRY